MPKEKSYSLLARSQSGFAFVNHAETTLPSCEIFTEHDNRTTIDIINVDMFSRICDGCSIQAWDAGSSGHLVQSNLRLACVLLVEKKEKIWLRPMTKNLTSTEKSKTQRDNTITLPNTSIIQRLRTGFKIQRFCACKMVIIRHIKAGPLRLEQLTNTLKIGILSETSINTLFDSLSFNHSNCGSPPVKTYANKRTWLEEN